MGELRPSLQPGDRVGRWVVERWLGAGAMGAVYRCRDAEDPELAAAVKVVTGPIDAVGRARFLREAEILHGLDHAFVCRFLDFGDDPLHLAMEFVEGETLTDYIARRERVPLDRALEIVRQVTEALAYVHARRVWHRDIKPDNVLVRPDGWVKLVDFGIAVKEGGARVTAEGMVSGTLAFMPPEAMEAGDPDPMLWDLYGVGILLHRMLTGERPFEVVGTDGKVDWRRGWYQKSEIHFLDPGQGFPHPVRALVKDLTARDPGQRLASAGELGRRLQRLQSRATRDLPLFKGSEDPGSAGEAARELEALLHDTPIPPEPSPTWTDQPELSPVPASPDGNATGPLAVLRRVGRWFKGS